MVYVSWAICTLCLGYLTLVALQIIMLLVSLLLWMLKKPEKLSIGSCLKDCFTLAIIRDGFTPKRKNESNQLKSSL